MAIIGVLGAGMMGSAICVPLADRGHDVRLVGTHLEGEIVGRLRSRGPHPGLHVTLPESVKVFPVHEIHAALANNDMFILGVSSAGVDWACERLRHYVEADRPLLMITKGLLWEGGRLQAIPDVVHARLGADAPPPAAIAGPCIAGELARRVASCVVLAGRDRALCDRLADMLRTDYYQVWTTDDVIGACACAALKNGYAMAYGFAGGLHERAGGEPGTVAMHNLESALFTQSVLEMQRIAVALGGRAETVVGLAGIGDLDVTNNGNRTGRFGYLLGLGL
ncbi:MAG TPA: 2-dehydropantoate 2-reductase N-terminal domain-containing protein, partial [Polyangiaceae bacterium]|nr:2-dehydropantoate 2-reductase N-terminal domain-containing protein [Polyangiaceae bacterium]